jgi:hypothetical protein
MYRILLKENSVLREEVRILKMKLKALEPYMIFEPPPECIIEPVILSEAEPDTIEESNESVDSVEDDTELDFGPILEIRQEPEPEPEARIELEPVNVSILDDPVVDNIVKYKCIKCGYKYKANCVLCKNNI